MDTITMTPESFCFLVLQYLANNSFHCIFSVKITGVISVFFLDPKDIQLFKIGRVESMLSS